MRNPYFFVFLLSGLIVNGSLAFQPMKAMAQATSKLSPGTGTNVDGKENKGTNSKASEGSKTKGPKSYLQQPPSQKISVGDLGTSVPDMPSESFTEAGTSAPGIVSGPTPLPASRYYSPTSSVENPTDVLMTQMGGILNLMGMASWVAQTASPRAGTGPMFINECVNCPPRDVGKSGEGVPLSNLVNHVRTPDRTSFNNRTGVHNVFQAESYHPFSEVGGGLQGVYTEASISAVLNFNSLLLYNVEEFSTLCPKYEELNHSQRAAFLTYLNSEIFKQTANYNNGQSIDAGRSGKAYGVCQLTFDETKTLKATYQQHAFVERMNVSDENSFLRFMHGNGNDQITQHVQICGLKILNGMIKDSMGGARPLQKTFPNVNFNQVKNKLQTLKMCQN